MKRCHALLLAVLVVLGCEPDRTTDPQISKKEMPVPKGVRRDDVIGDASLYSNIVHGVYYFAGWKTYPLDLYDGTEVPHALDPWGLIRDSHSGVLPDNVTPYNYTRDRKPFLGFIDEDNQATADAQILAMRDAGFRFVSYQVGWSHDKWRGYGPAADPAYFEYAAKNHITSQYASQLKMAITWHDPWGAPQKVPGYWGDQNRGWTPQLYLDDVDAMVNTWFTRYIDNNPNFYRVNGKAVVFIFAAENINRVASFFNLSASTVINHMRAVAAQHGDALYLVATSVEPTAVVTSSPKAESRRRF